MNNSYAQILFDVVSNKEECAYNLLTLKQAIDEDVYRFFNSEIISKEEKKKIIDELNVDSYLTNFLKILIDENNFKHFNEIVGDYQELFYQHHNILEINIVVAKPLSSVDYKNIIKQLETNTNKTVVLKTTIDPNIIGGIKIMYEDKVIDNTISNKLKQIEKEIRRDVL